MAQVLDKGQSGLKTQENPLRDAARIVVYYGMPALVRILPPGVDFALYRAMGRLFAKISRRFRNHVESNLSETFPDLNKGQISGLAEDYFKNHFVDRMQMFSFPGFNEGNINRYVELVNGERLTAALDKGRGCVLIHGHYGPAQLFIACIALAGFPITQVGYMAKRNYSAIGQKVAVGARLRLESCIPGEIFYADKFLRPVIRKLKNNEVVANSGDGTGGGEFIGKHITVPFLGGERPFPVGSVTMAQRTGAELLPLFLSQSTDGRYSVVLDEPIDVLPGEKGITQAVHEFADRFTNQVRSQPALWHFWDEFPKAFESVAG